MTSNEIADHLTKDDNTFHYQMNIINKTEVHEASSLKKLLGALLALLIGLLVIDYLEIISFDISYAILFFIIISISLYMRLVVSSFYARFTNIENYIKNQEIERVSRK